MRGTKLVLISAGAFGSPAILERSGIGARDVLDRVGVKQRVDLPGVGNNYQGFSVLFLRDSDMSFLIFTSAVQTTISSSLSTSQQMNHNLWLRYSATRKERLMVRLFSFHREACFTINHGTAAMAAEFGKTRKEITTHKCTNS